MRPGIEERFAFFSCFRSEDFSIPQRGLEAQEGGHISREKMFSTEQSPAISGIAPIILGFLKTTGLSFVQNMSDGPVKRDADSVHAKTQAENSLPAFYTPRGCHTISVGFTDPVPEKMKGMSISSDGTDPRLRMTRFNRKKTIFHSGTWLNVPWRRPCSSVFFITLMTKSVPSDGSRSIVPSS